MAQQRQTTAKKTTTAKRSSKSQKKSKPPVKKKTPTAKESKLREDLKRAGQEIDALKDQLLRTAAELDNYRKRTEREYSQLVDQANRNLILDILPAIDDLERSLKTHPKQDGREFREGIEMIHTKLLTILRNRGLEPLDTLGKPFDVEQHDAILQLEKDGEDPNIILEEIEKGYVLNGRVIRHAKVVVSK
jgi:molecular chaperone GrpE